LNVSRTPIRIGRRAVLRGAGGLAFGLPLLEAMVDTDPVLAQLAPRRFLVVWCGVGVGHDDGDALVAPTGPGGPLSSVALPLGIDPLDGFREDVSIITGMRIPIDGGPGARPTNDGDFHGQPLGPLVSGVRGRSGTRRAQGASSDYVMAGEIGGETRIPHLTIKVQADGYAYYDVPITYSGAGSEIESTASPSGVWDTLFRDFTPPGMEMPEEPMPDPAAERSRRKREAVLDLVRRSTDRLLPRLGAYDRARLGQHLAAIDELRRRVTAIDGGGVMPDTSACVVPGAPPASFPRGDNYGGEEERAAAMVDLVHMAFACDITRVVGMSMSEPMPALTIPTSITGCERLLDLHEYSHSARQRDHALGFRWHTRHFANLLEKLRSTPDGAGTLLDATAILFVSESGRVQDVGRGGSDENSGAHNTTDMMLVVAGCGDRLRLGHHIVAEDEHPVKALIATMQAAGYSGSTHGEVSGALASVLI
jgi:hypothetical protein